MEDSWNSFQWRHRSLPPTIVWHDPELKARLDNFRLWKNRKTVVELWSSWKLILKTAWSSWSTLVLKKIQKSTFFGFDYLSLNFFQILFLRIWFGILKFPSYQKKFTALHLIANFLFYFNAKFVLKIWAWIRNSPKYVISKSIITINVP